MTTDSKGNAYTASLLFRSLRDGVFLPANLWEESLIFVRAISREEAEEKASQIGRSRALSYKIEDGTELTWEFFKVERVFEIDGPLESGIEIFSRHLRNAEVESLLTPFNE
jgi:hypothetical protein